MARGEKLLERMRGNPRDWGIEDVATLCSAFEIDFDRPSGGSHYGVSEPARARPINQVYIKKLVRFVDAVIAARLEAKKE